MSNYKEIELTKHGQDQLENDLNKLVGENSYRAAQLLIKLKLAKQMLIQYDEIGPERALYLLMLRTQLRQTAEYCHRFVVSLDKEYDIANSREIFNGMENMVKDLVDKGSK